MALLQNLLGIGANSISWYQAAARAVIVYIATLLMIQVGEKRFLGRSTMFDIILGIVLGSLVSSAINNLADILPTLVAGFVLIGMHWLFSVITFRSNALDNLLKGSSHKLVENGQIDWKAMKANYITREDLLEQMRAVGNTEDLDEVRKAYFERSGQISILTAEPRVRVVEVKVEPGVQVVRIVVE